MKTTPIRPKIYGLAGWRFAGRCPRPTTARFRPLWPLATICPSGENDTEWTWSVSGSARPSRVAISWPLSTSHNRTAPFEMTSYILSKNPSPLAKVLPSGENDAELT